ncbi:secreted RxLR effector protein 161-like [Nicotiana sylvestris]|uniref:secreted RxLR effector protein 161-like n=1 Tax=Nicotiana sylvestris TaxID=4096 RepID=UPI00388CA33A
MLKSIRILLSIAAHYDYEIWQMDVKTAFLNGSLDECIYMMQLNGFVESGKEHMLYDILLIENNVGMLDSIKQWFSMHDSKKGFLPFRHGVSLSKDQSPKTNGEIEKMKAVPYASAMGSLMYVMLCTRPDICFVVGVVSRFQSNPGREHWTTVKHIIKYLKRTRDYMLVYHSDELVPIGYTNSDFQSDKDSRKSTSGNVLTLGGGAISWRSIKQTCIADSTMEDEYVAASEAAKEAIWLENFLRE